MSKVFKKEVFLVLDNVHRGSEALVENLKTKPEYIDPRLERIETISFSGIEIPRRLSAVLKERAIFFGKTFFGYMSIN